MIHERTELFLIEVGWCAAAEMQLFDFAFAIEQLGLHFNFAVQHFHVTGNAIFVACDDLVAAAVIAKRMAEGDVDV